MMMIGWSRVPVIYSMIGWFHDMHIAVACLL
jgi:hypothetical protein